MTTPGYVLAIDQGTTGTTAILFNQDGQIIEKAYEEFSQYFPQSGWVEHDAEEIFESALSVCRDLLRKTQISPEHIVTTGITNQRETVVVWDRSSGKPIAPAIVWQCRRTTDMCKDLKNQGLEKEITAKTGLILDPYFSATKLAWLLENIPGAKKKAEQGELAFGNIDSWLVYCLSKGTTHVTDFTNASRTLLFDIHRKKWSSRLCEIFDLPESLLPRVVHSSEDIANIDASFFGHPICISGMAGDQQSALYGHGATKPGMTKCTFGTGAFAVTYTGSKAVDSKHGLLSTLACDDNGKPAYALEGSIFMAGATIQWLRDELRLIQKASETEGIANSIQDTQGVYLVPAFTGLGAPHWDPTARGALVGLTRGTNRRHIIRAALESIAHQTVDLVEAMENDCGVPIRELCVDGGAIENQFLAQHLSDLLNKPLRRPKLLEMTALGAAKLAAKAKCFWNENASPSYLEDSFLPSMSSSERDKLRSGWKQAVDRVVNT